MPRRFRTRAWLPGPAPRARRRAAIFFDSKAVRLLLTPAQIEAVSRKTPVQTLSVRAVDEVVVGRQPNGSVKGLP